MNNPTLLHQRYHAAADQQRVFIINPAGTLTMGSTSQQFVLQGSSTSTITATNGANTTTVGFTGTPTGNVRYNFDQSAAGTYAICTTANNCAYATTSTTLSGDITGGFYHHQCSKLQGTTPDREQPADQPNAGLQTDRHGST